MVKTDSTEDDKIFDYDNLMVDKDKENDDESGADSELEKGGENEESGYNNWNEI